MKPHERERVLGLDTSPAIEERMVEIYRRMSPAQKMAKICDLIALSDKMAVLGLRRRYPNASDRELKVRLSALKYDRELMVQAFSWDPRDRGY